MKIDGKEGNNASKQILRILATKKARWLPNELK